MSALLADHNKLKASNNKDPLVGDKYKLSNAIEQLTAVLEAFKSSNIEIPAEKASGADGDGAGKEAGADADGAGKDAGAEAGADDAEKEGGDDDEGAGGAEGEDGKEKVEGDGDAKVVASMDPGVYDSDDYSYEGWEAVPAIFLKQATVNPYFGDLVKGHIINHEFLQAKSKADKWNGAAGLITSALSSAKREPTEAWFSGRVGEEDLGGL